MLDPHEAASIFPLMDSARYAELRDDIQRNGQLLPIILQDGKILDGRNRYMACLELGVTPLTQEQSGNPWEMVWTLNGTRRDLDKSQRAVIKMKCDRASAQWRKEQQLLRQSIDEKANQQRSEFAQERARTERGTFQPEVVPKERPLDKDKSRIARAQDSSVSASTQAKVEWLANKRPDLLDKVAAGDMSGIEALRRMKKDEVADKVEALPEDKYRLIYADPPWDYGDKFYCAPDRHYPSMKLADIKALDVPALAADDAVLFMWATSPMLLLMSQPHGAF